MKSDDLSIKQRKIVLLGSAKELLQSEHELVTFTVCYSTEVLFMIYKQNKTKIFMHIAFMGHLLFDQNSAIFTLRFEV